jgi:DNA-binding transcriptional LysR family regulator
MPLPDLRKLAHAVALADTGSFIRASEQLNLTQSALTRSIQALEKELGITLFDRGKQGVVPTRDGANLLKRARALLLHGRTLESEVRLLRDNVTGNAALGLGPAMAPLLLYRLLLDFNRDHPRFGIEVFVESPARLVDRLHDGTIECFVAEAGHLQLKDTEPLNVEALAALDVKLFARAGHPLADREVVSVQDLSTCIQATSQYERSSWNKPDTNNNGLRPTIVCNDFPSMKQLLVNSDVVMFGFETTFSDELASGQVCCLPFDGLDYQQPRTISLVTLAHRTPSAACVKIIDWIRRFFKDRESHA